MKEATQSKKKYFIRIFKSNCAHFSDYIWSIVFYSNIKSSNDFNGPYI